MTHSETPKAKMVPESSPLIRSPKNSENTDSNTSVENSTAILRPPSKVLIMARSSNRLTRTDASALYHTILASPLTSLGTSDQKPLQWPSWPFNLLDKKLDGLTAGATTTAEFLHMSTRSGKVISILLVACSSPMMSQSTRWALEKLGYLYCGTSDFGTLLSCPNSVLRMVSLRFNDSFQECGLMT